MPDRPAPPGPLAAILVVLLVLYVQGVIGGLFGFFLAFGAFFEAGFRGAAGPEDLQGLLGRATIYVVAPSAAASGVVALAVLRRLLPDGLAPIGWRLPTPPAALAAAAAGLACGLAYVGLLLAVQPDVEPASMGTMARAATAGGGQRIAWAVTALLVAPPVEELLFRGVLFAGLERRWGVTAAAVVTALGFLLTHVGEAGSIATAWFGLTALTVAVTLVRIRTGSLAACLATHVAYNLVIVSLVFAAG